MAEKKLYKILVRVDMDDLSIIARQYCEEEDVDEDMIHETLQDQVGDVLCATDPSMDFLDLQECHPDDTVQYGEQEPYFKRRNMT